MVDIKYDKQGLVPVVIQDYKDGTVLMLAYMNDQALKKTMETGQVWFYSRSRKSLWHKGETSGNFQNVKEIFADCDRDSLLIRVEQVGGIACHTGSRSCFFNGLNPPIEATQKKVLE